MKIDEVRMTAFAMPLTSPSFPPGPYRFVNREFLIVTYRTDLDALRAVVPEPLQIEEPIVKYEFIRMPDSTGFGDYTESGQVIPVVFNGQRGGYVHSMYLNDDAPIAGGRELWGFPKKLASPALGVEKDTMLEPKPVREALMAPSYLLKIIPHVDGTPRICELVRYYLEDVVVKGAWTGPAALELAHHALAPVAQLPVLEIISGTHILSDLTLGLGTVVFDYLGQSQESTI
jgi:acetoacetate decarboxylase